MLYLGPLIPASGPWADLCMTCQHTAAIPTIWSITEAELVDQCKPRRTLLGRLVRRHRHSQRWTPYRSIGGHQNQGVATTADSSRK